MQNITQNQLVGLLTNLRGNTFVSIIAQTDPRMRKTGNPFLGAVKVTETGGQMNGADYENAVNKRLDGGGFKAADRRWGSYVANTGGKVVENKGKLYLSLRFRRNSTVKTQFFFEGEEIARETLSPWLPTPPVSRRQSEAGLNEEDHVICRDYGFDSILQITVGGETYRMVKG